jgi:hypothetical protein
MDDQDNLINLPPTHSVQRMKLKSVINTGDYGIILRFIYNIYRNMGMQAL